MDVNEAFDNYVLSLKPFQVLTPYQAWQAACEWQKQKDAEICANEEEAMWEIFDGQPSEYHEGRADCASWLASAILNQGKDNG